MQAVVIKRHGAAEVLEYVEQPDPIATPGMVVVAQEVIGVNFIDIYHRRGLYPRTLPSILGMEGGGRVLKVGDGVAGYSVGDRVIYVGDLGCYAQQVAVPAESLLSLAALGGEQLGLPIAVAALLQGLTAHYLLHDIFKVNHHHTILVHAAAGGVGRLLCQWARRSGATVIGTVSSAAKAQMALQAGAHHIVRYDQQDMVASIRESTRSSGGMVDVIFDSVGETTLVLGLELLKPCGMLVSFGQSSGALPTLDLQQLAAKSLTLTRPSLFHYISSRAQLEQRANELFRALASAILDIYIYKELSLSRAGEAHRLLESRRTSGKLLLRP